MLTKRQSQNWFSKFLSCNFDLKVAPRSARSVETDEDQINALVDADRRITTREIAGRLNLHNRIKSFFSIKKKKKRTLLHLHTKNEIILRTTITRRVVDSVRIEGISRLDVIEWK